MIYKFVTRPILFRFNPDLVHERFTDLGEFLGRYEITRSLLAKIYDYHGPKISKNIDGIDYRTPVMLAAGFDYNARLTTILPSLGFGGVEVGSVTARPSAGNPFPHLHRAVRSKSIVVFKGLENEGAEAIARRLSKRPKRSDFVIGISIARTNDKESASNEEGIRDYVKTLKIFNSAGLGDYYTLNISCPNAFTGETFTTPVLLQSLLKEIKKVSTRRPLYIKMPINLPWDRFRELVKVAVSYGIQGVIIGNLNKDYSYLDFREEAPSEFRGGVSGKPCFKLSNGLISRTKDEFGKKLTVIGCGGIFSPEDAMEKFRRGADLVQLITGMIFEGPSLIKKIARGYSTARKNNIARDF